MRDPQAGAVLIVDASTIERRAVREMLAPLGYRIVGADSEAAALRAVEHERFAVIVMDARRPKPRRLRGGQAHPAADAGRS